ncbi:hypothetical protein ACFOLC_02880 [Lysobacter cavernae]|uniref:Uncharacterized protein n=1 Tax=Lysobacter cavernae TaxID=1685901 RepID=A0ABV7RMU0_9GAMM
MAPVVVMTLCFGLIGCASSSSSTKPSDGDGDSCSKLMRKGNQVYIDIGYAGDGRPSATPDKCKVKPGTQITWRNPGGDLRPFEIVFPGETPAATVDRRGLTAQMRDGRYKVVITAGNKTGTYKYGITANGISVDPEIIIH